MKKKIVTTEVSEVLDPCEQYRGSSSYSYVSWLNEVYRGYCYNDKYNAYTIQEWLDKNNLLAQDLFYIYENGYETEKEYMDFGKAVALLKNGTRVARDGWNGTVMFVAYQKGYTDGIQCMPYLQMRTADGTHQIWVASQSDILAEDWFVVE